MSEELQQQIEEKENELQAAKEELAKFKDKDYNFSVLRKNIDEKNEEVEKLRKEIEEKNKLLEESKNEFTNKTIEIYAEDSLKALAGEDQELQEKIKQNYERIKDEALTKEDVFKKMKDAYAMTVGSQTTEKKEANPLFTAYQTINRENKKEEIKQETVDLAKELGIKHIYEEKK